MTDTIFCDVSQFQPVVNDQYPYKFFSFRIGDGTYHDTHAAQNLAWAKKAADSGKIAGFIGYVVYEPSADWVGLVKDMIGTPHPKMAIMIDVESWGGKIGGDHSSSINAGREKLIDWLGGNRARVIGYGNQYDLNELWHSKGDTKLIVAAYGSDPSYPGEIAHQYSSGGTVAPFGHPVDMNSADGRTPEQFAGQLGLAGTASTGGTKVMKHYINDDAKALASGGHTLAPGDGTYLNIKADTPNTHASNVVGGVGEYSFVLHLVASGAPGDAVDVVLMWDNTKTSGPHSEHYVERVVIGASGKAYANIPFARAVASGYAVYARAAMPSDNKGNVNLTRFSSDALLFG